MNIWLELSEPSSCLSKAAVFEEYVKEKHVKVAGEHEKVRKMFHVEHAYEVLDGCEFENGDLIDEHLTKHEKKQNMNAFKKYSLNFEEQTRMLTQCASDNCTKSGFVTNGSDFTAKHTHDCGSASKQTLCTRIEAVDLSCVLHSLHARESATEFSITSQPNATASDEGKWLQKKVGGIVTQFMQHAVKVSKSKFNTKQPRLCRIVINTARDRKQMK